MKLLRPLALTAALGTAAALGESLLRAEPPKPAAPAAPPAAAAPADPAKAAKADEKPLAPVKITNDKVETKTAVKPKPLTAAVKRGLEYLVKNQQEDGGWNQGGGWRTQTNGQGGRVEGANVEDPSDIGNTCFALLALFRAGHTPISGEYKAAVAKGLKFVLDKVEKADKDSLFVTDVKGTQLQSKIGPYVDTFLVNLVLAEMRGSAGPEEKRLTAALEKTMNKIVKHQNEQGGFANNGGWAPTLSVGICNKSFARARQNGVQFDDRVLTRAFDQSKMAAAGTAAAPAAGAATATKPAADSLAIGRPAATSGPAPAARAEFAPGGFGGGTGDAGVRLYSFGQGAGNAQDVVNGLKVDAEKAKEVLKDAKAGKEEKEVARKKLETFEKAAKDNAKVQEQLAVNVRQPGFVAGFGSNGGEEFLSFLNISEALLVKGGKDWTDWDKKMTDGLEKAQDQNGSWNGQHCITGKTFCTAAALLVLMADRTPFPVDILKAQAEGKPEVKEPEKK